MYIMYICCDSRLSANTFGLGPWSPTGVMTVLIDNMLFPLLVFDCHIEINLNLASHAEDVESQKPVPVEAEFSL